MTGYELVVAALAYLAAVLAALAFPFLCAAVAGIVRNVVVWIMRDALRSIDDGEKRRRA